MTRPRIADSYRARLIVGYMLVAAVFAAAWLWSLYGPLTQSVLRQQEISLSALARANALYASESSATPQAVALKLAANDVRVTIVAADGKVLADSGNDPAGMENHADRPEVAAALGGATGSARRVSKTDGVEELYIAVPARVGGRSVALRVSQPLAEVGAIARTSRQVGLALLMVALVIAAIIASWASGAAARPIRELSVAAKRMASGDLSVGIPEVPADLDALASALQSLREQMKSRLSALEGEQKTLRTALDGLYDAVFLLEGETIRYANGAAGRIFRTPAGGWRDIELSRAGLPESLAAPIREHVSSGRPFLAELDPDPTGTWLRVAVVPIDTAREGGRVLVVVSDVTDRARLESVRRDFVANASHELKTPVAGIQLLAESAENAAADGDIDQSLAFTKQIEAEAFRLKRLVGDLLDLSRLESAPAPDALTDVRQAVENAIVGHRSASNRAELDLDVDLSAISGVDIYVAAEPTDVAVALDNLLDNAIAYTERGGVTVRVEADASQVRIVVQDTGSGVSAEHLPRIFERFYRVDRARSRESGGTGLGLALVRHVAERSGGSVSVASEVGTGTTFTLTLPRAV